MNKLKPKNYEKAKFIYLRIDCITYCFMLDSDDNNDLSGDDLLIGVWKPVKSVEN